MVSGVILCVKIEPTDAPLITRSESTQSTYDKCHWSIGGPERRNCPFYSPDPWSHWGCLAYVMNCSHSDNYHCAKDLEGNWKEACDQFKLCQEGLYACSQHCQINWFIMLMNDTYFAN